MFRSFNFLAPKYFKIVWLSNILALSVPDEGYSRNVHDEGYSRNVPDEGYWTYLMKVIERTWWRLLNVPDEGYWTYWWRLFQKRIVRIQFDIYIFIMTIVTIYKILNLKIKLTATI